MGTPNRSQFATHLKMYREARRWSQERLATESEMDHSLVSRLESDQRTPTREAVLKLSVGLELAAIDRDRLLMLAGYMPIDATSLLVREPALAAIYTFLSDQKVPDRDRGRVRDLIESVARVAIPTS